MSNFVRSDILNLSQTIKRDFDLVMSTGNSLAHVQNVNLKKAFSQMDSVLKPGGLLYFDSRNWELNVNLKKAFSQMDSVLKPGGLLYFDSRNWELILKRRQRFYLFNPIIRDKGRVNYIQVWDYNRDGSMVFNFLIFEEINNKIISKRQFYVIYYPFTVETIRLILEEMNYQNIQFFKMGDPENTNLQNSNWYSVMATKPFPELLK